ncbi:MAG: hypothetical protein ACLR7D_11655 [Lachnospira eligens]
MTPPKAVFEAGDKAHVSGNWEEIVKVDKVIGINQYNIRELKTDVSGRAEKCWKMKVKRRYRALLLVHEGGCSKIAAVWGWRPVKILGEFI